MAGLWAIALGMVAGGFRGVRQGGAPLWLLAIGLTLPAVLSLTDAYFRAPEEFESISVVAFGAVVAFLSAGVFLLSLLGSLLCVILLRGLIRR